MPIYCDEAGYTGYNLLEENQPYFVYAALNLEEAEAINFRNHLKKKYNLQGELKGRNLVRSNNGRKAIQELYESHVNNVRLVYHHKKYALACKYFEYVFEPALSNYNTFFYRQSFHRFISHLVYISFEASNKRAEDIFWAFQELLRGNNKDGLFQLLKEKDLPNQLIALISEFTILQRNSVLNEITTDGTIDFWVLDLAQTALYNLLCNWSEQVGGLSVICDVSQPLKDAVNRNPLFSTLNADLKYWDPLGQGKMPLNFTLNEQIHFSSSGKCYGLQLADIFASSVYWTLNNPDDYLSKYISDYGPQLINGTDNLCISPEPLKFLDPDSIEFNFGVMALRRLTEFSHHSPENAGKMFMEFLAKNVSLIK
jgi:uncharacterized protein DUF3800